MQGREWEKIMQKISGKWDFSHKKTILGMGKAKARISISNDNVCDLGREWEMNNFYYGKSIWKNSGNYFFKRKGKFTLIL